MGYIFRKLPAPDSACAKRSGQEAGSPVQPGVNGLDKFPFGIGVGKPIVRVSLGKPPFQLGVCLRCFRMAVQIVTETDTSLEVRIVR